MPKCVQCGQLLTLAERAKLTMICAACTKKFETEVAPNIGKLGGGDPPAATGPPHHSRREALSGTWPARRR